MTATTRPGVVLEMQFSGSAGAWTDIAADVLTQPGIRARYGIFGTDARARVADTGILSFSLNNSQTNSGGLLGYYSPGHANARSGFEIGIGVRLGLTWSGSTFYKFRGTLDSVSPEPGQRLGRQVRCIAVDWMDEAAKRKVRLVATQENKRANQIIDTIIGTMPRKPAASSLATGQDIFPYAIDNSLDEHFTPMGVFQQLMQSELGFLLIRGDTSTGGVLTFQDRHARPIAGSALTSLTDSEIEYLRPMRSRATVYNNVKVTVHPRRTDSAAAILYQLNSVPKINPGETIDLQGGYVDPTGRFDRIGIVEACALTATTDYLLNTQENGAGIDRTANATVAASFGANSWRATISGVADEINWLTHFQIRGRGLYDYEPLILEANDDDSSACHGVTTLDFDAPAQTSATVGRDMAEYLLAVWKAPQTMGDTVEFTGNNSDALMLAGLQREPGDRVSITETVSGITDDFYVHAVTVTAAARNVVTFGWTLAPTDPFDAWILGTTGLSEIGTTTVLGY